MKKMLCILITVPTVPIGIPTVEGRPDTILIYVVFKSEFVVNKKPLKFEDKIAGSKLFNW